MEQLLGSLPALADLIQKGGVVGVLLIACGVLVYEIKRGRSQAHDLRNELHIVYGQRDRAALMVVQLKTLCEANKIPVDITGVRDLIDKLLPPTPDRA